MGEAGAAGARARPSAKLRPSADLQLIECVRMRPVLYDPSHPGYMDYALKMRIWHKIARQINASPKACKERWNNIRDNYRKSLRSNRPNARYKFSSLLGFMDPFYKMKTKAGDNTDGALHNDEKLDDDVSNDAGDAKDGDVTSDTSETVQISDIKVEHSSVEEQSESMVDYDYFEKSSSSAPARLTLQAQAVDAFLGALAPPLKAMSPYHLALAKAEIFATVHKYELKGIVEAGWEVKDPLP